MNWESSCETFQIHLNAPHKTWIGSPPHQFIDVNSTHIKFIYLSDILITNNSLFCVLNECASIVRFAWLLLLFCTSRCPGYSSCVHIFLKFVFSILVSLLQMNSNYHGAAAFEPRDTALKSINFASNDECSVSVTVVHVFDVKIIKWR